MAKPIVVHTEELNSYGFWLKTQGCRLDRYKKNPVMLWNHKRATWGGENDVLPIGNMTDINITPDGKITCTPKFSENYEFAQRIGKMYEEGTIRAASVGIKVLAVSERPEDLKPGQTRGTVTDWEIREISLTDIPANASAVVLYDEDGQVLNLNGGGQSPLPVLSLSTSNNHHTNKTMEELKIVAGLLGLPSTASLSDVQDAIANMKGKASQASALETQLAEFRKKEEQRQKQQAETLLAEAARSNRITNEQRAHFANLFEKDFDGTKAILESLQPAATLTAIPNPASKSDGDGKCEGMTFGQLRQKQPKKLQELKENDPETFKALYKAEYGTEYVFPK